ncbi:MAG: response regulator [Anaerolineales bacterium]|nr:response regulator [Anaerolineales bacterium]
MTENSEDKIRLLIVDDHPPTRENIRKLVQFEQDIEVVGTARSGEEALEIARETQPDVVLMDINMPGMDGISATEALLEDVPFAQIIILSVQNETDYMRRAMLAGARDFISKPPSGDELISTIRTVSERAKETRKKLSKPVPQHELPGKMQGYGIPSRPEGKILTVYSAKGGVGCTTIATNLAIGLNSEETPVVLVDASLQFGDVSAFLNLQVKNSLADLASRVNELEEEIVQEVLMKHETGLSVLAAPARPEMADEVQADQVRKILQYLRRNFAYVIVDTSSTIDDITLAVLDVTDVLLAVATPEIPAIKDARLLFDLLTALDFPTSRLMFVLNRTDRRIGITAKMVSDNLKHPVHGDIPIDERAMLLSVNKGVPLLLTDKTSPIAKAMLDLLSEVKEHLLAAEDTELEDAEQDRARIFNR